MSDKETYFLLQELAFSACNVILSTMLNQLFLPWFQLSAYFSKLRTVFLSFNCKPHKSNKSNSCLTAYTTRILQLCYLKLKIEKVFCLSMIRKPLDCSWISSNSFSSSNKLSCRLGISSSSFGIKLVDSSESFSISSILAESYKS